MFSSTTSRPRSGRVVAIGGADVGTREQLPRGRIAIMQDPEGNEFTLASWLRQRGDRHPAIGDTDSLVEVRTLCGGVPCADVSASSGWQDSNGIRCLQRPVGRRCRCVGEGAEGHRSAGKNMRVVAPVRQVGRMVISLSRQPSGSARRWRAGRHRRRSGSATRPCCPLRSRGAIACMFARTSAVSPEPRDDVVGDHVVGGPEPSEAFVLLSEDLGVAGKCHPVGPRCSRGRRRGTSAAITSASRHLSSMSREIGTEQHRNLHGYSVAILDTL